MSNPPKKEILMATKIKFNKFCFIVLPALILIPLFLSAGQSLLDAAQMAAVITAAKGDVQVLPYQQTKPNAAKVGDFIYEGDTLKAGKGSQAAVTFANGAVVKINQNTEFAIDMTQSAEDIGTKIKMVGGKIWASVRPKSKFEIHTPVAVVAVRGTEFETNLLGGRLSLAVFSGTVNIKNKFGEVDVGAGKQTTVNGDNPPEPPSDQKEGEKPTWQEEMGTKNTVKMDLALTSVDANAANDINISVVDANGVVDEKYNDYIELKSDNAKAEFSKDGSKWASELRTDAVKGRLSAKIRIGASGDIMLSASADKATSCVAKLSVKKTDKNKKLKLTIESKTGRKDVTIRFKKKQ